MNPISKTTLDETRWVLVSHHGEHAEMNYTQTPHMTIDVARATAQGFGGINQFHSDIAYCDDNLQFGPIAATRRAGPRPLMEAEATLFRALAATKKFCLDGSALTLLDESGRTLAEFRAAKN